MVKPSVFILAEVFCLCCFVVGISLAAPNINTDQSALLALKNHIRVDPHSVLAFNWTANTSVCNWIGITCSTRHLRVMTLDLTFMNLTGTIPPQLGNLSFLTSLNVANNSFYGSLPHELANLHRLRYLSLRYNDFNTQIPPWIGFMSKLQYLYLDGNSFLGAIPPSIFNLSSLQVIDLSFNQLSGSLPANIFNLSALRTINFRENQLSGPLPSAISNTSIIQVIDIQHNSLSGALPDNLFRSLPQLERLHLAYNQLDNRIPLSILGCKRLQFLVLSVNNFTGSIPQEIGNLTALRHLYLGYNNLVGAIPREIGNLRNLEVLSLLSNYLDGELPSEIFNLSSLTAFTIAANQISGSIPSNIGLTLPNLQGLFLGGNRLSGHIPSSVSNASMITYLDLLYNSFSGPIPRSIADLRFLQWLNLGGNNLTVDSSSFLTSLTNCKDLRGIILAENPLISGVLPHSIGNLSTKLEQLYLGSSNIRGRIPLEIGNLSNLITLHLENNEFSGPIPNTIGRLQKLQGLYLQNNELQGSIPVDLCNLENLGELYLNTNRLEAPIPECFGNLISLRTLSLGSNRLTSMIPSTIWKLKDILHVDLASNSLVGSLPRDIGNLKVVSHIDLSSNQFLGDIPITIGGLKHLQYLSLANNMFQGSIPDSFGDLTSLEFLDLSNNTISGNIPGSLEELIFLKYLNVSFNSLEGEIPKEGPFLNFSAQSFMGNKGLCGVPRLKFSPCKAINKQKTSRAVKKILMYVLPITASIIIVAAFILVYIIHWVRKVKLQNDEEISPQMMWKRISYEELSQATNGFSEKNLLGKGSFGSVYKGTLPGGKQIAVKVLHLRLEGALKSFKAECEVLRNIRHRNLVRIISSCSSNDFKALVLEYMPNGSLEKWLYDDINCFDTLERLNIAIDVASALEYLHHGYDTPIIHCDLKPSNVLLDESMVAHLSDFGISKLLGEEASMTRTQTLATVGYMAPEYGREGNVSRKGDIFSYGIMLMEIFTRKKPTDEMFSEEMSLKSWVNDSLNGSVMDVIDDNLLRREVKHFDVEEQCLSSILNLALACTRESLEDRIDVKEVVTRLLKVRQTLLANIEKD